MRLRRWRATGVYDTLEASRVHLVEVRPAGDGPAYEQLSRLIIADEDLEKAAMILGESFESGEVYEVRLGRFPAFDLESHGLDLLSEWRARDEPPWPRLWVARSDAKKFDKIDVTWGPPPVPGRGS